MIHHHRPHTHHNDTHSSNLATGVDSSNTHPTPGPANSTPTASRHDLLAAAYRLFEAAVTLPPAPAAAAEADERRRVVLLMVRSLPPLCRLSCCGGMSTHFLTTHCNLYQTQLAVSASLAVRTGNEAGALSGRERSYWLAQLGEIRRYVMCVFLGMWW